MARYLPKVHRRDGDTLRLTLQGRVGPRPGEKKGISSIAVEAALLAHRRAPHVEVRITSPGGNVYDAEKVVAALDRHPGYITTIADGECCSAATLILMAGDFRQATHGTKLLFHAVEIPPEKGGRWTREKHLTIAALLQREDQKLVDLYAARTGRSAEMFAKEIRNERLMSLNRAADLGVIDCLEGEEIWRNGRPFAWHGYPASSPPALLALRWDEFSKARQAFIAGASNGQQRGRVFGHLAFTRAGGFDGPRSMDEGAGQ
ncbi:MAG: ATP-dependent Clp protease proteolytic subunit [Bradyrhizobium sp.]|uniref:ATP-dependent Clp protease proteolytic subunit n=1 Tax=Bradyrhizobium sp. TaxID=376 RepID=UPI0027257FDE|nr:ATP-dependent Clp protease proteolytic subunit [Bradyrhizobium sp.]MDO8398906.1 ATP-dependent Clp protease proteolytic subunit [Bradyrhizobium sp.]